MSQIKIIKQRVNGNGQDDHNISDLRKTNGITNYINKLTNAAQKVSLGDLRVEISNSGAKGEIGILMNSFKEMVMNLRNLVRQTQDSSLDLSSSAQQIASSAEQMNAAVQQVSSTVQQMAKGSQVQAQALEETNEIIEQASITMNELATKARLAEEASISVGKIADSGSKSAVDAADKMSKIIHVSEQSSEKIKDLAQRTDQITSVLSVIRKIADQTNLLALNAAIEAARAGEAGRGFAVVADEVKRLAVGSAKSSEEIAHLIKQIQEDAKLTVQTIEEGTQEISEGITVIDKALQALNTISAKVQDLNTNVVEVSVSSKSQLSAMEQLRKKVSDIAAVAEENAAATEEASAATEQQTAGMQEITNTAKHLANLGEDLKKIVVKFTLPETTESETKSRKHMQSLKDENMIQTESVEADNLSMIMERGN